MDNRIFLTGDTHGSLEINKIGYKSFPIGKELDKNSYICVLGDFGCVWNLDKEDNYWLDWLNDKNFTTLFIPGNHECYPLLRSFPVEQWHGGVVRKIRPSVIMLERGETYNICNHSFFCFGAARSTDRHLRVEGRSWWPEEQATWEEYEHGVKNLIEKNNTIDYILTHCAPNYIVDKIYTFAPEYDDTTNYLEKCIRQEINFKRWFMGHYHQDRSFDDQKYNILYNDIVEILPNDEIKFYATWR